MSNFMQMRLRFHFGRSDVIRDIRNVFKFNVYYVTKRFFIDDPKSYPLEQQLGIMYAKWIPAMEIILKEAG